MPDDFEKGNRRSMNVLSMENRVRITAALVEGNSIRATERLTGVNRGTIMSWGVSLGESCAKLHNARVSGLYAHLVQLDEIWTFVQKKQRNRRESETDEHGDQFVFVAIDALSKLVISHLVGKRTAANTQTFCDDVRARIVVAPQVSTDGFVPYQNAIEFAFGTRVHHGVAVKLYEDESEPGTEQRYSPSRVTGVRRTAISGSPISENISTSFVERQNLTMRQGMRRFTRLSNGFSKKLENLKSAVALHFAYYNFCRVHMTIRVTPAMQAGLTDHVWSLEELIELALAAPEPSNDAPAPIAALANRRAVPVLRVIRGGRAM